MDSNEHEDQQEAQSASITNFLDDSERLHTLWDEAISNHDIEEDHEVIERHLLHGVFQGLGLPPSDHQACFEACLRKFGNLLKAPKSVNWSQKTTVSRKTAELNERNFNHGEEWVLNAALLVPSFILREIRPNTGSGNDAAGVFFKRHKQWARMPAAIQNFIPHESVQLTDLPDDQKAERYAPAPPKKRKAKEPEPETDPEPTCPKKTKKTSAPVKTAQQDDENPKIGSGLTKTNLIVVSREDVLDKHEAILARMDPFCDEQATADELNFITEYIIRVLPAHHRRNVRNLAKTHGRKDIMDWCAMHKDTDEERIEYVKKEKCAEPSKWESANPTRAALDQLDELLKAVNQKEGGKAWQIQAVVNRLRTYEAQYDVIWEKAQSLACENSQKLDMIIKMMGKGPSTEDKQYRQSAPQGSLTPPLTPQCLLQGSYGQAQMLETLTHLRGVVNPEKRESLPSASALKEFDWLLDQMGADIAMKVRSRRSDEDGKGTVQKSNSPEPEEDDDYTSGLGFLQHSPPQLSKSDSPFSNTGQRMSHT